MNYIIDISNIKTGGGRRIALTFVEYLLAKRNLDDYRVIVSKQDYEFFRHELSAVKLLKFNTILHYYFWILLNKHDVYFSLFGPGKIFSVRAKRRIAGVAIPHIIYQDYFEESMPTLFLRIRVLIQRYIFSLFFNEYWTETMDAKYKLSNFFVGEIHVVPNAIDHGFEKFRDDQVDVVERSIFVPSAYYVHKNIEFIAEFAKTKTGQKYSFIFTLDDANYARIFGDLSNCRNLGFIDKEQLAFYYQSSQIVLNLSSLEVYSGNYVESAYFGTPIVVLRRSFTESLLKNYALYIDRLCFTELESALNGATSIDFEARREFMVYLGFNKHEKLYAICFG